MKNIKVLELVCLSDVSLAVVEGGFNAENAFNNSSTVSSDWIGGYVTDMGCIPPFLPTPTAPDFPVPDDFERPRHGWY